MLPEASWDQLVAAWKESEKWQTHQKRSAAARRSAMTRKRKTLKESLEDRFLSTAGCTVGLVRWELVKTLVHAARRPRPHVRLPSLTRLRGNG